MAQETEVADRHSVSLALPAEIRMNVVAADEEEARAIIAGIFGAGDWQTALLDLGWTPPRIGMAFAVRLKEEAAPAPEGLLSP